MSQQNVSQNTERLLNAIWLNWVVAYGAITLPLLLAIFTPKIWLPFVCLAEAYILISLMKGDVTNSVSRCTLIGVLASRVLLLSALSMLIVCILCTDFLVPTVIHLNLYNSEIPFVSCLVMMPITALLALCTLYLGLGSRTCRECQRQNGYYAGDSIIATLYYREAKYQVGVLLILSVVTGAVEYWYYFARYINAYMDAPDRFFFNFIPMAMYVLSVLFMRGRYASMRMLFETIAEANPNADNSTLVRFLIFSGDKLLLQPDDENKWDTPAQMVVSRTYAMGEKQAADLLSGKTGLEDFKLRYCFANEGFATSSNVLHFAAFVPESSNGIPGATAAQWFDAYMLDRGLAKNTLSQVLANELYRIHTMTMAWKTYNREGKRLYPIKHYRPTFRLGDLSRWDIDYDDTTWFDVAHNNEDRHFFMLRRLWGRMTGIFRHRNLSHQQ